MNPGIEHGFSADGDAVVGIVGRGGTRVVTGALLRGLGRTVVAEVRRVAGPFYGTI